MSHTDLLTPTQLGLSINTSDVVRYDGSTLTTISPVGTPDLNSVVLATDSELTAINVAIAALTAHSTATSQVSVYDGVPTFACFAFVGSTLNAVIDELGLQICINSTAIGALNTTDIATGAATPLMNAAPYPVGAAVADSDEAFIAIDAAIQVLDTDKLNTASALTLIDAAISVFIVSGTIPTTGAGPFDVDIPTTSYYKGATAASTGGIETAAPTTVVVVASRDNYIDYNLTASAYVLTSVVNGAAEPAVAANHVRVTLAITDGVGITSISDISDRASIGSVNLKRSAVNTVHITDGAITDPKLAVSGAVAATYAFANVTVTDKGIVTSISSEVDLTGLIDEDFLKFDTASGDWLRVPLVGGILPSGAALNDHIEWNGAAWVAAAPIAFTAIPLTGTVAAISGDLEMVAGVKIFQATESITWNAADLTVAGNDLIINTTAFTVTSVSTFSDAINITESALPVPPANGIVVYAADRAAVAGTSGFNIIAEDGTEHIFSDLVGIGTSTPDASAAMEVNSTTGGFRVPNMTTGQRDAIAAPAEGLIIYNTSTNQFQGRNNATWTNL